MNGIFVTGTDTEVGKTFVSAGLVRAFVRQGKRCAGMKPIAAGFIESHGRWINEDVDRLKAASNVDLPDDVINPCALREPMAPHIAAQREGRTIDVAAIRSAATRIASLSDVMVVEGVGGFRIPLTEAYDTAHLATDLGLPVVLVVGMRLGCLNHALLTAEAVAARGLTLAGWVANCIDPAMTARDENIACLVRELDAPRLGTIPYLSGAFADEVADHLDIHLLKGLAT
jgi:dethiobiotin synthetase